MKVRFAVLEWNERGQYQLMVFTICADREMQTCVSV